MSLDLLTLDKKEEKELFNSTINKWGLIRTNINPLKAIGNKKNRNSPNYNSRQAWEVHLIGKLNYSDKKNPRTQAVSSTYDSIVELADALDDVYEHYADRNSGTTNIGVVIEDKRQNRFYAGHLNLAEAPSTELTLTG